MRLYRNTQTSQPRQINDAHETRQQQQDSLRIYTKAHNKAAIIQANKRELAFVFGRKKTRPNNFPLALRRYGKFTRGRSATGAVHYYTKGRGIMRADSEKSHDNLTLRPALKATLGMPQVEKGLWVTIPEPIVDYVAHNTGDDSSYKNDLSQGLRLCTGIQQKYYVHGRFRNESGNKHS